PIWQRAQEDGIHKTEDRRVSSHAEGQRQGSNQREAGMFEQHTHAISQVLNHRVLPSVGLHPQRIPKCAGAAPEQIDPVAPSEAIPLGEHHLSVSQLGFPLLPPIGSESTWHDHADEVNKPEMRFHAFSYCSVTRDAALKTTSGNFNRTVV